MVKPRFPHVILTVPVLCLLAATVQAEQEQYDLVFSTYIGGSNWESARDISVDGEGNIYIVGGTASSDYPVGPEHAYDLTFDSGGAATGDAGDCDVFVSKFSPTGSLLWGQQVGGIGSTKGALIGSILVGLTDTLGGVLLPETFKLFMDPASATAVGSALASMLIYILMAVVLIVKPMGLYGARA